MELSGVILYFQWGKSLDVAICIYCNPIEELQDLK